MAGKPFAAFAALTGGVELYDTLTDKTRTDEEKKLGSGVIAAKTGGALGGALMEALPVQRC